MKPKNDIIIEVNAGTNDIPDWQQLDLTPGEQFALDLINNLFTDISSITSSSTACTIKIPRTIHNDKVFDCAYNPTYNSSFPYRYHECRCRINDIDITGKSYMYLVSVEDGFYGIVIVFGLMQNCKKWIEDAPGLRQLPDNGESIQWDWQAAYTDGPHAGMPDPWAPIWYGNDAASYEANNGLSKAMYFGIYNPGFPLTYENVVWANVHPFVTLREIWERIKAANNLNFVLPSDVERDMEDVVLVLTKIEGNTPNGTPTIHTTTLQETSPMFGRYPKYKFGFHMADEGYFDLSNNSANRIYSKGVKPVVLNINIFLHNASDLIFDVDGDLTKLQLMVYDSIIDARQYITPQNMGNGELYYHGQVTLTGRDNEDERQGRIQSDVIGRMNVEIVSSRSWDIVRPHLSEITTTGTVQYIIYENAVDYPNTFLMIPNLPDISQLEFVKAVCGMYCLFPVINSAEDEIVHFVKFDTLEEGILKAYDWSDKHLETDRYAPKYADFDIGIFAKRNRIAYKTDDKENVTSEAFIEVKDDTLEKEKDLVVFPWAASNGNTINQYNIVKESDTSTEPPTETYKAEFTECEYRLMRVQEWYNYALKKVTRLSFYNLSPEYLISQYYTTYIGTSTESKQLKENIMLNEIDLKEMDFTRPMYLKKYGRFFAVKSIRWNTNNPYSEVELIQLD